MEQKTLEGSWEEILEHIAELAGQQVRLGILFIKLYDQQFHKRR